MHIPLCRERRKVFIISKQRLLLILLLSIPQLQSCSNDETQNTNKGDQIAPVFVSQSLPSGVITGSFDVAWQLQESNPARVGILLSQDGGSTYTTLTSINDGSLSGSYNWDSTAQSDGTDYRMKLVAYDIPGNSSSIESTIFEIGNNAKPFLSVGAVPTSHSPVTISWTGNNLQNTSLDIAYIDVSQTQNVEQSIESGISLTNDSNGQYVWNDSGLNGNFKLVFTVHKFGYPDFKATSNAFILDNIAPSLVKDDIHFSYDSTASEVKMDWTAATDNIDTSLLYSVESFDEPTTAWTSISQINTTSTSLGALPNAIQKYLRVSVRDEAGNMVNFTPSHVEGFVDPNFSHPELLNQSAYVRATTMDGVGRLLVAKDSLSSTLLISRLDSQGNADTSLGGTGDIEIPSSNTTLSLSSPTTASIIVDPNYKNGNSTYRILSCGHDLKTASDYQMFIIALNDDGSVDTTFNQTGAQFLPSNPVSIETNCHALAVDSNNNVYAVGETSTTGDVTGYDVVVVKFDKNGNFDTTFGTGGVLSLAPFDLFHNDIRERVLGIAVDTNDNLYLTGRSNLTNSQSGTYEMYVAKFDSSGSAVNFSATQPATNVIHSTSFSVLGSGLVASAGYKIILDDNGDIYVGGVVYEGISENIPMPTVWRFLASGEVDASFNDEVPVPATSAKVNGRVLVDSDMFESSGVPLGFTKTTRNRVLISYSIANVGSPSSYNSYVDRLTSTGIDKTYAINGKLTVALPTSSPDTPNAFVAPKLIAKTLNFNPINERVYFNGSHESGGHYLLSFY